MRFKLQGALMLLTIFILFMTIVEYLLKFGFKEFSFHNLMGILPGMALDFGILALFTVIYYLIKFRKRK
jgi:hypothetical protein